PAYQPLDRAVKLLDLGPTLAGANRFRDAVFRVVGEEQKRDSVEGRLHRTHLREDVDAVSVFLDHLLDASDLSLEPPKPPLHRSFVCRISRHAGSIPPRGIGGETRAGSTDQGLACQFAS